MTLRRDRRVRDIPVDVDRRQPVEVKHALREELCWDCFGVLNSRHFADTYDATERPTWACAVLFQKRQPTVTGIVSWGQPEVAA